MSEAMKKVRGNSLLGRLLMLLRLRRLLDPSSRDRRNARYERKVEPADIIWCESLGHYPYSIPARSFSYCFYSIPHLWCSTVCMLSRSQCLLLETQKGYSLNLDSCW